MCPHTRPCSVAPGALTPTNANQLGKVFVTSSCQKTEQSHFSQGDGILKLHECEEQQFCLSLISGDLLFLFWNPRLRQQQRCRQPSPLQVCLRSSTSGAIPQSPSPLHWPCQAATSRKTLFQRQLVPVTARVTPMATGTRGPCPAEPPNAPASSGSGCQRLTGLFCVTATKPSHTHQPSMLMATNTEELRCVSQKR